MTPETVLEAVDAVMGQPFEWGPCDCSSAACDVFLRLWGIDPMASVRSQYRGQRGAIRLVRQMGGFVQMTATLAARSGLSEGHAVGGIALSSDRRSLLICITPGHWAGKTETSLALLREAAWRWHAQNSPLSTALVGFTPEPADAGPVVAAASFLVGGLDSAR